MRRRVRNAQLKDQPRIVVYLDARDPVDVSVAFVGFRPSTGSVVQLLGECLIGDELSVNPRGGSRICRPAEGMGVCSRAWSRSDAFAAYGDITTKTRWLIRHEFEVTGVDASPVQIDRARGLVPEAHYVLADMAEVDFPADSFDAVIALYSLFHLPLDEQRGLILSVGRCLRPGRPFLAIVGTKEWTGTEDNWLGAGATMWWSHEKGDTYLAWFSDAGFEVRWRRFVPEGDGGHDLILAVSGQHAEA